MAKVMDGLKYTKTHEWIKVEGKKATVGLADYAQDHLGDIVFVETPEVGRVLKQGEVFGVVESVKAVSDCYAPAGGKVTKVNEALADSPEKINADPYGTWIFEMELSSEADLANLLDPKAYDKFANEEGGGH